MTITKLVNKSDDLKSYKLSEVAERDGKDSNDVWIVIKDLVYDVTGYLENHPGGSELIVEFAGKDCTKEFYDAGHSTDAIKDLKKYLIGGLIDEDKKSSKSKSKIITNENDELSEAKKKRKRRGFLFC